MKVAFINISLRPDSQRRQLPVGLAYVMTAVERAGIEFDLIDMDINALSMENLDQILARQNYDVIACGCIVTGYKFVREIASIVKKHNPDCLVIAGNSVATSIPKILLGHTEVDIAVMGEADITIVEILTAIENGDPLTDIKGIVIKQADKLIYTPERPVIPNIDDIGFPNWEIFELEKYFNFANINVNSFSSDEVLSFPLNSARGCPFSCTFCYHVFKGKKYRKCSEAAVLSEIVRLHEKYGCDFVSFWDELSFPNAKSAAERVSGLEKLDFKIGWTAPTRGNVFSEKDIGLIRAMRDVGCDAISFSLENGDAGILAAMNKKMDVADFVNQAKVLFEGGVTPLTSLVFGYPQETPETIRKTLAICEECNIYPSVGFLLPLPGTPIYEWACDNGYIPDEIEYLERIGDRQDFHINLTKMSDEEFVGTVTTMLADLAKKQGLEFKSVLKTVTYQKPKTSPDKKNN